MKIPNKQYAVLVGMFILIALIALGSFILSFTNIVDVSDPYYNELSFVLPLIVDMGLLVFIIARFVASLTDDQFTRRWALILAIVIAGLSLLLNQVSTVYLVITQGVTTSEDMFNVFVSFIVHLIPPLLLIASTEVAVAMTNGLLKRMEVFTQSDKIVKAAQAEATVIVDEAQQHARDLLLDEEQQLREIQQRKLYINQLDGLVLERQEEFREITWNNMLASLSENELAVLGEVGRPQRTIAKELDLSTTTVSKIIKNLQENGYIYTNGVGHYKVGIDNVEFEQLIK